MMQPRASAASGNLLRRGASRTVDVAPNPSRWFEAAMLLLSAYLLSGAYLDAWAHRHIARLETFFTPWHGVLYSAVLATGLFLFVNLMQGRQAGRSWSTALPCGYGLSFVGFVLFGLGGVLDLTWHTLFGIEQRYAASLSPTHLLLMLSTFLMVSGGLRSALSSARRYLGYAGLLSATFVLAELTFFSQDLHPFTSQWSSLHAPAWIRNDQGEELGVLGVILQSAFLMAIVLFLVRRFALPPGALTIMLTLTTVAIVAQADLDPILIVGVAGGLVGDVLLTALHPTPIRRLALRAFAFLLPAAIYLLYFAGIIVVDGTWWPIHVWTGAVVVAAVTGLLVSYLVVPPGGSQRLETLVEPAPIPNPL